jgi:hypothetical protein
MTDVYFHTVLFPAMLIGDGRPWTMLHNISSTRKLGTPMLMSKLTIRIPQLRRHQIQQKSKCRVSLRFIDPGPADKPVYSETTLVRLVNQLRSGDTT